MAKLGSIKKAKRTAKPSKPFGSPAQDELIEILIPEGAETGKIPARDDYIGKLTTLITGKSKRSGNDMLTFGFQIVKGDYKHMDFQLYCPKVTAAMWKLGEVMTALGVDYEPGKRFKLDRKEVLGTLVRLVIIDDKTNTGREVSKLAGVLPHPDGAGKKAKNKSAFTPPDEEEEEEDIEEQDEDQDEDQDEAQDEEGDEDEDEDEDEGEDDDEDDDEEGDEDDEEDEEEKDAGDWAKGMKAPAKKTTKKSKKAEPEDEDEDEDEDEEEEVKPKRRRAAVKETPVKKPRGRPKKR